MKFNISKKQARRFLLKKQLLLDPQILDSKTGVEKVFNHLRLIQYDPLNPCGRNTDLVLQSRIKNYHPEDYYTWLYKEKNGIELYDKELCILPIEDAPLSRLREGQFLKRTEQITFLRTHQKEIEKLFEQIKKYGPITTGVFKSETRVRSNWGTDSTFSSVALDSLWKMGRLVVVKRERMKKYYDLPDRFHGKLVSQTQAQHEITKEHILRRLQSVGLLPISGNGGGWQGLGPTREVAKLIRELIKDEKLVEVIVTGCKRSYVISSNDKKIIQTNLSADNKKVTFIAPLDNLMWDREMIHELFNFYYRWEVYVPFKKRVYGYYVLPILYGDEFIGRIEPVMTNDKKLIIKGFWQEKETTWNDGMWKSFYEGLENFKEYLGATEIINTPV